MVVLGTGVVVLIGLLGPPGRRRRGRTGRGRHRRGEPEHLGERRARDVGDRHQPRRRRRVAVGVRRARPPDRCAGARRWARCADWPRSRVPNCCCSSRCSPSRSRGERARTGRRIGAAVGASVLVVAPWVVYNLSRFDQPVFLSTNDGLALAGSNCDRRLLRRRYRVDVVRRDRSLRRRAAATGRPERGREGVSQPGDRLRRAITRAGRRWWPRRASDGRGACSGRSTWSTSTRARGASRG